MHRPQLVPLGLAPHGDDELRTALDHARGTREPVQANLGALEIEQERRGNL